MPRPLRLVLALAVLALVAAGCGRGEGVRTTAETEGLYLDVGGLKYQVQLSRYMNPSDTEDAEYLVGMSDAATAPTGEETYFGVWVRVQNESDEPHAAADTWEIHDTQENVYRPVAVDTEVNPFVYEGGTVPPRTVWPLVDSAAGQGPTQGQLLIFKVTTDSLQNRPLELIFSAGDETGTYALDV